MKETVTDLRYLKLAELYEDAYERFVVDVALRTIKDDKVREKLMQLTGSGEPGQDHRARVVAEINRLNATLTDDDSAAVLRAALLDVIEVERSARDFYLKTVDRLHDPIVVRLFRDLAREEARHARIAEDALAEVDARSPRIRTAPLTEEELAELANAEPMLREGVIDFGKPPHGSRGSGTHHVPKP